MTEGYALEHGTTRTGRWLRTRRLRAALWIAVIEAIIVAFAHGVSRWTVTALAIAFVAIYVVWGRQTRSDTLHQLSWIAAASQALAVVAVVAAFIIGAFVLILAAVFAVVALALILSERR